MKEITLHFAAETDVRACGDGILIQNAVRNILDNAIKYSPQDSQVWIRVETRDGLARITVEDQAGGFGKEDTEALTQRFVRGANARDTIGSGLGLTIAREVAEAHAGQLLIKNSETGAGACVTLCFPAP